jgi:tetratricopeptide (TPR) repeat protein
MIDDSSGSKSKLAIEEIDGLVRRKRYEIALAKCNAALSEYGCTPELASRQLLILQKTSTPEQVIAAAGTLSSVLGKRAIAIHKIDAFRALNKFDEAIAEVESVIADDPLDLPFRLKKAELLALNRELSAAENEFKALISEFPKNRRVEIAFARFVANDLQDIEAGLRLVERVIESAPTNLRAQRLRIKLIESLKDKDALIVAYRDAIKANPESIELYHDFGIYLGRQRKFDEAIVAFQNAIKIRPTADLHYHVSVLSSDLFRVHDAMAHAEKAVALDSDYPEAQAALGLALRKIGKFEKALPHFERAIIDRPESSWIWSDYVQALASLKRFDDALAAAQKFREANPNTVAAYNLVARVLIDSGQPIKALEVLDDCPENLRKEFQLLVARGLTFRRLNRSEESISTWKELVQLFPDRSSAHIHLGHAFELSKELDLALDTFKSALAISPDDSHALMHVADIQIRKRDYRDALATLERALSSKDDFSSSAWLGKAYALERLRNFDAALNAVNEAIKVHPESDSALTLKGAILIDLHRYDEALDAYSKAVAIAPKNLIALKNKAYCLAMLEDYDSSIAVLSQVIELNRGDAIAYANRGGIRLKLGDASAAIRDCSRALKFNPKLERAQLDLVKAYLADDNCMDARERLSIILAATPEAAEALWLSASCHIARGNTTKDVDSFLDAAADLDKSLLITRRRPGNEERKKVEAQLLAQRGYARAMQLDLGRARQDFDECLRLSAGNPALYNVAAANLRRINGRIASEFTLHRWVPYVMSAITLLFLAVATCAMWQKILPGTTYATLLSIGLVISMLAFLMPAINRLKVAGVELERTSFSLTTQLSLERAATHPFSEIVFTEFHQDSDSMFINILRTH